MIPIRDAVRSGTFPVVNALIIGINIVAFPVGAGAGSTFKRGSFPFRYAVGRKSECLSGFKVTRIISGG